MQEQTYPLRRWRENDKEEWKWSLKDIKDGKTEFFVTNQKLFKHLTSDNQTPEK